ncbi:MULTISPECIES: YibL family ribosome-associated protein [Spongiibacter]|uniref:YibL family ribosome-associated protein n=1 Tax=Spongiibacter TaxID=630749 RepID=UPI002580E4E7|nr:YibL family ribosome-associated protein [Spongiibacter sp. UBA1325]
MNLNKEIQQINNKLDLQRRKRQAAVSRGDDILIAQFDREIAALEKRRASIKGQQSRSNSSKAEMLQAMKFKRALSKAEQADMGKLKKSVKGLVVVHPLTALGREMGLEEVTGFSPKAF